MAIAYVNAGAYTSGATNPATSIDVGIPASLVSGNVLVGLVHTTVSTGAHGWPGGWTLIEQRADGAGGSTSYAYKVSDGLDTAPTVTVTSSYVEGRIFQYSGCLTDGSNRTSNNGATGTHSVSAITSTIDNTWAVFLDLGNPGGTSLTTPSGFTMDSEATNGRRLSVGHKAIATSGTSSGAISTPGAATSWTMFLFELRPPLDFSITMDASVKVDFSSDYEFWPYEHDADIALKVDATSDLIVSENVYDADIALTVSLEATIEFHVPLDYQHGAEIPLKVSLDSVYDGPELMEAALTVTFSSVVEFVAVDSATITATAPATSAVLTARVEASGTVAARAPMATAVLSGGAQGIVLTVPMATAAFTALVGQNASLAATARAATASLVGGTLGIFATAPMATAAFTANSGVATTIVARAPKSTVAFTVVQTIVGRPAATAAHGTAVLTAVQGVIGTVVVTAPFPKAAVTAFTMPAAVITVTVPMATASFLGGMGQNNVTFSVRAPVASAYLRGTQTIPGLLSVEAVVVNTVTAAVTEYAAYHYDSFCTIGSTVYGAGADGLYELDSAVTDEGLAINAHFEYGTTDFGSEYLKRLESVYAAYRTTGDINVTVRGDDGLAYVYPMKFDGNTGLKQRRVPTGKGLRGKYWRIRVDNVNGSGFGFDTVNLLAHETVRRIGA